MAAASAAIFPSRASASGRDVRSRVAARAGLSLIVEQAKDQCGGGGIEIGILEDDEGGLSAEFERDGLQRPSCGFGDLTANYVNFAAARPQLYVALMSRFLQGGEIPAAEQAWQLLLGRVQAVAAQGRLATSVEAAADHVWACANAAALLYVTARQRHREPPDPSVVTDLRERAIKTIIRS